MLLCLMKVKIHFIKCNNSLYSVMNDSLICSCLPIKPCHIMVQFRKCSNVPYPNASWESQVEDQWQQESPSFSGPCDIMKTSEGLELRFQLHEHFPASGLTPHETVDYFWCHERCSVALFVYRVTIEMLWWP